jgi:hypothetical protein
MSDHFELWIFRRLRPTNLLRLSQPQTRYGSLYLLPVLSLVECNNHIILTKFQGSMTGMKREGDLSKQLHSQSYFVACYAAPYAVGSACARLATYHVSASPIVIAMQQPLGYPEAPSPLSPFPSGTCLGNDRHLSEISALIYLLPDGQCFS